MRVSCYYDFIPQLCPELMFYVYHPFCAQPRAKDCNSLRSMTFSLDLTMIGGKKGNTHEKGGDR